LRESKGIQDLIEAVALLPAQYKTDLKIDIYGDGPYKDQLVQAIAKHQLQENFIFHGSTDSLKGVFCQYDYLLHPTHMECFSLTLLESLAANVPVVTTPVGGNTEVVRHGENGFLFETQNAEQLASLLEKLIIGEKKITANTRTDIAERFTIERMVDEHFNRL
jgi:glycosyltransferase involved in cell wall biosynthesis